MEAGERQARRGEGVGEVDGLQLVTQPAFRYNGLGRYSMAVAALRRQAVDPSSALEMFTKLNIASRHQLAAVSPDNSNAPLSAPVENSPPPPVETHPC